MKKLLKILTTIAAVLAAALFFAGCKQFLEDPEEFLGYWSSEVVPIDFSIDEPYQTSNDGALCVPSADDVKLTVKLRNPRNFALIMPTSALDAGKVINFPGFPSDQQPEYNTDYTFRQTGDMLELTYKDTFLKAHEWSNGAIGPEITLISTDGRKFGKKFSLNIEVNTPPPEIGDIKIAKTQVGGFYALCFDETVGMTPILNGKRLHKDIKAIHIQKEGDSEETIPLTVKDDGSGFNIPPTPPDGLLSSVDQLFDVPPSPGSWTVYVKTYTELAEDGALPKKYKVWLTDKKGLSSEPKEAKTLGSIPDISDNTKAWKKLKQAVEGAQEGGVITVMGEVKATQHSGNNGAISVTTSLTIKGSGLAPVLNANKNTGSKPAHRIFTVENGGELTLENITITDGMATGTTLEGKYGGGILVKEGGKAKLKNCTIKKCEADKFGGGICSEGKLTLAGGTIGGSSTDANKAQYGGAICVRKGSVIMESGLLMTNKATTSGGGVNVDGYGASFTMTGGEIKSNNADTGGGGVFVHEGTFTLSGSASIESNTASGDGGGIYVDSTGKLVIEGGSIKSNMATKTSEYPGNGGGVYVYGGGSTEVRLDMSGGLIEGNSAGKDGSNNYEGSGGGVYIKSSTFTMTGGEIKTNKAKNGGGVALDEGGTLTFSGGKIINNTAENNGDGGGICVGTIEDTDENTGTLTMTGGEISGNTANGGGGIAVLHGTFTMSDGKVIGNTATTKGGGILGFSLRKAKGEITVSGGKISSNTAGSSGTNAGGGICSRHKLTVLGGDIKINKATFGYGGGIGVDDGIFNFLGGTVSGNETKNPDPASALGKGIFVDRRVTMTMSGSAKVDTGNDVYLGNYGTTKAFITVTGPLANELAATLTMANDATGYVIGRVVVKGDGYALKETDIGKFPITSQTVPYSKDWTTKLEGNQLKLKER
nr:hypothetical protein [Treponema denticola]